MSRCRSGSAEILWAKTQNGKLIPLDPLPGYAGNIILEEGAKGEKYAVVLKKGDPRPRGQVYRNHMVTCTERGRPYRPAAGKYRKPGSGQIVEHLKSR